MKRLAEWFSAERRQKIQIAIASIAPLLIVFGLTSQSDVDQFVIILGAVLAAAGPLLSLANLSRSEFAGWVITSARGVLYGAAAVIVPALVALGWVTDEQSTTTLALISTSLTVLASVVAIFTSGEQSTAAIVEVTRDRAIVSALTAPLPAQVADLSAAAQRLGVDPNEVTREMYRASGDLDGSSSD
jgi:hypothetical protein